MTDQEKLDALIARSTTDFVDDTAQTIGQYAFYNYSGIQSIDVSAKTISANAFNGASNLAHLILRSTSMATLSATSAFTGTKIASGNGAIYVPSNLVATYKANSNWKNYFIYPISEYPKTDFSTVTDSWTTIASGANYDNYSVGDTKIIDVMDTKLYMQLVAKDLDTLSSDHTSKAKMSWVCKSILTSRRFNATSTTSGGWAEAELRGWLIDTVLPSLPEEVRNNIKPVDKTYRTKSPNDETLIISDTIWIPSYKEVGFTNSTYVESDGVVYSGVFNSATNRIKYNASGSAGFWWLRSAHSAAIFRGVDSSGSENSSRASTANGVVFGFCL